MPTGTIENRIRQGGMLNLGNTGYMEVILQSLYHCSEFRDMILSLNLYFEPRENPMVFQMVRELQKIFHEWRVLEHALPKAEDPQGLVKHEVLRLVYSHINPYIGSIGYVDPTSFVDAVKNCIQLRHAIDEPNDAHDFFSAFLRRLQIFFQVERMPSSAKSIFQRIFVTPQSKIKLCFQCGEIIPDSTILLQGGVLAYCFDCPVVSPLQQDEEQHSHLTPIFLQALRDGDGNYGVRLGNHCACSPNQTVAARICKRHVYSNMPTLLTVRIKRWPIGNRNAYFEFDEFLDLSELLEPLDATLIYRLLSIVIHHGSTNGYGRYFSYTRSGNQWGQFWGQKVLPVEWETVQKESFGGHNGGQPSEDITNVGYMLIYEKELRG